MLVASTVTTTVNLGLVVLESFDSTVHAVAQGSRAYDASSSPNGGRVLGCEGTNTDLVASECYLRADLARVLRWGEDVGVLAHSLNALHSTSRTLAEGLRKSFTVGP